MYLILWTAFFSKSNSAILSHDVPINRTQIPLVIFLSDYRNRLKFFLLLLFLEKQKTKFSSSWSWEWNITEFQSLSSLFSLLFFFSLTHLWISITFALEQKPRVRKNLRSISIFKEKIYQWNFKAFSWKMKRRICSIDVNFVNIFWHQWESGIISIWTKRALLLCSLQLFCLHRD